MRANLLITLAAASLFTMGLTPAAHAETVIASQDPLLSRYDDSDRLYYYVQIDDVVSYFHQRTSGDAIVEKDFVRYQFVADTGDLIEHTVQWRDEVPAWVDPVISREEAEAMVAGTVQFSTLYMISPESNVFPIQPTPRNPCWAVRSIDNESLRVSVIDALTGELVGYGVPPPVDGLALTGPGVDDPNDCSEPWEDWYTNARDWFDAMGYLAIGLEYPRTDTIRQHLQSDDVEMFYELAHGNSTSFRNWCPEYTTSTDIETWLASYASVPFAFVGSCNGLCDTIAGTFAYEFRKGQPAYAVVVGYCGMNTPACGEACFVYSVDWQDVLFDWMSAGHTVGAAFAAADLAYPVCSNGACMRIAGDTSLTVVPHVTRSVCGPYYDTYGPMFFFNYRPYYIRCDVEVPYRQTLTVEPDVEVAFMNDSKITAYGSLSADGTTGEIRFVSAEDDGKGMRCAGEFRMLDGGQITVPE